MNVILNRELIKSILLEFDWHDYGLDEVELAQSDEWAAALAAVIAEALEKTS